MIEPVIFESIIRELDFGTSTAEKDPLLPSAQIRTQEFWDLYYDRIDLVRGIKGAGKTALYRVFELLQDDFANNNALFCIFGVEATGDPVFNQFREQFNAYGAVEFERFWGLYFLTLIRNKVAKDPTLAKHFNVRDLQKLDEVWKKLEIPNPDGSLFGIVQALTDKLRGTKRIEGSVKVEPTETGLAYKPGLSLEFEGKEAVPAKPIYVGDARDEIGKILKEKKLRVWIFMDRLDEVFTRRSSEESNGLKGLLKAAYNLSSPELRIKIFMRDDIIEQLAQAPEGFTALTHVTDRASPTMRWAREGLLLLIVKRLYANPTASGYFQIDQKKIDTDAAYREECFNYALPPKIGKLGTLDWIVSSCADSNGIVSPRDVIDLLNFAKAIQYKEFHLNKCPHEHLISADALKEGFELLSQQKRHKYLRAEFPHMWDNIGRLEGGYSIHNAQSLENAFGSKWATITADLVSVGLFKHDPKKAVYKIPKLWLKGLRITQGRAFGGSYAD